MLAAVRTMLAAVVRTMLVGAITMLATAVRTMQAAAARTMQAAAVRTMLAAAVRTMLAAAVRTIQAEVTRMQATATRTQAGAMTIQATRGLATANRTQAGPMAVRLATILNHELRGWCVLDVALFTLVQARCNGRRLLKMVIYRIRTTIQLQPSRMLISLQRLQPSPAQQQLPTTRQRRGLPAARTQAGPMTVLATSATGREWDLLNEAVFGMLHNTLEISMVRVQMVVQAQLLQMPTSRQRLQLSPAQQP